MRGRKARIEILLFPDKRKRPRKVEVEAMVYGPLAYHRGVARDGELMNRWVVTHIKTGLTWPFEFDQRTAREVALDLLAQGINWDFGDRERMSKPDRRRAAEVVERMKRKQ